jgi:hydrogenase nickel incorporation protein HypA/HybF
MKTSAPASSGRSFTRVHELALAENIVDAVTSRVGSRGVERVRLRIGALVAVMPDAMRFCFDVAAHATPLEGAILEIESVMARARCEDCRTEFEMVDRLPLCACGSVNMTVLSGEELVIQDVKVR